MAMQTDVLATRLGASGVVSATRARVKGYQILPGATAGQIIFYDNASAASGTVRLTLDINTATALITLLVPGEGILFQRGVYVSLPTSTNITVFYG